MAEGNPQGTEQAEFATASLLGLLDSDEGQDTQPEEVLDEYEDADELEAADESEDETAEDVEDEGAQTYTVKVNGEEVEVTEDELLNGYSRQRDYIHKTEQLANARKEMEAEFQAVQQERQLYAQYLGQLAQATKPQRPDFEALAKDHGIEAAMQARIQYEGAMERYNELTSEQQEAMRRAQAQQAKAKQEWQAQEHAALLKARPEWKDPDTFKSAASEIEEFALEFGYTTDQLADVSHKDVLILDAARKWFAANSKAQQLKPSRGKVLRPGGKGQVQGKSRARKARERYQKSGSVEDGAEALRHILG